MSATGSKFELVMTEPRKVFLTGASSGIGLATAKALAAAGCKVWGTARQRDRLPGDLTRFHPVELDLNDEKSLRENFATAEIEAGGRFDVLINNAGGGWFGPAAEIPESDLREQFQTLALGPIALIQLALPGMRRQAGGLVINVTSLAARLPLLYGAAYSAAKAALSTYTVTLQMEEDAQKTRSASEGERVRFIDLQPGDIRTGFNRSMRYWSGLDDAARATSTTVRHALSASDKSIDGAPPPEKVAECIRRLVITGGGTGSPLLTCGNFWQAGLGPLAYRFLPPRLLLWVIRQNSGL